MREPGRRTKFSDCRIIDSRTRPDRTGGYVLQRTMRCMTILLAFHLMDRSFSADRYPHHLAWVTGSINCASCWMIAPDIDSLEAIMAREDRTKGFWCRSITQTR